MQRDDPPVVMQQAVTPSPVTPRNRRLSTLWQGDPLLWSVTTLILLLLFVGYTIPIWFRWARPDPELLSFSANLVGIIALVSLLGLQTKWGGDVAQALWARLSQRWPWFKDKRTGFVVCLLLATIAILGFYRGLPSLAHFHNQRGLTAQEAGQFTTAAEAFRRAVSLSPRQASYHFNSGSAYERLGNFDQAITEYQRALDLDDCLWPAYNSLGVIYIMQKSSPDAALTLLLAALTRTQGTCATRVATPAEQSLAAGIIRKNIAWAYLEKGLPQNALAELGKAEVALNDYEASGDNAGGVAIYRAETLRLAALAHATLANEMEAKQAWAGSEGFARAVIASDACRERSSLANVYCLNAQIWANEAQERLNTP
jgi:tetratricopeptide (TPR) repeat protein